MRSRCCGLCWWCRVNPYNIYAPCVGPSDPSGGCLTQQMALSFAARPDRAPQDTGDLFSSVGTRLHCSALAFLQRLT
jgi:hypothetical protein